MVHGIGNIVVQWVIRVLHTLIFEEHFVDNLALSGVQVGPTAIR